MLSSECDSGLTCSSLVAVIPYFQLDLERTQVTDLIFLRYIFNLVTINSGSSKLLTH